MTRWLTVIGIGDDGLDGLSPTARARLDAAAAVAGSARHLAMLGEDSRRHIPWPKRIEDCFDDIAALAPAPVAVLASGDPLWFGVGVMLARRFGPGEMEVLPSPSAFSLAAARLHWPLAHVDCLRFQGHPDAPLEPHIAPGRRLLILSRDGSTPARVAARLAARGFGPSAMHVLEHMGGPLERVRSATAETFDIGDIPDLNTVAVECRPGPGVRLLAATPGLADDAFAHDGQITKREVRAATLARLVPLPGATLWDVGAGSGAVAIEWLRAAPGAHAFAIESRPDRAGTMRDNALALGVPQLRVIEGAAPDAFGDLPDPDAVFLGGGLAGAPGLVEAALARLRPGGRLVANAVTLETEALLIAARAAHGGELVRIAVSRAGPVGPYTGWRPLMPVTQWALQLPWAAEP